MCLLRPLFAGKFTMCKKRHFKRCEGAMRVSCDVIRANFASHHTRDCYVGFLFAWDGIWKSNKMFHNFLFSSCHIIKLQPRDRNISTHILLKFQILSYSKSEVQSLFVVFLLTALYKRKPRDVAKSCTRMRIPRRANFLYDKRSRTPGLWDN